MARLAIRVEGIHLQPSKILREAGGPDDRGDAFASAPDSDAQVRWEITGSGAA